MNTSGINNLQNQYALYSGTASNTTSATNTNSTTQSTVGSTADTVTISPEALALQQATDSETNIEPPIYTPSAGGGFSVRPPV